MLLGHLVWNDRNFMEAFTADYSFLNSDLARLYGVPAPAGEFELVQVSRSAPHGRASWARRRSSRRPPGPVETSPTARGIFVREQLLCQQVPESAARREHELPEPSTDRSRPTRSASACRACAQSGVLGLPPPDGSDRLRLREIRRHRRMARQGDHGEFAGAGERARASRSSCRHRTATGEIAGMPNSAFPTAQTRASSGDSPECQECVVKQVFRYAFGRPETRCRPDDGSAARSATFRKLGVQVQRAC